MCKDANVDVYIAIIPENGCMEAVYPPERDQEINLTSNEKIKKEKHYVWRLLEYAVLNSFGFCMEDMAFQKTKRGKWITPNCEFSLSHSNGVVAVAVSRFRVGIDIEIAHGACSPRIAPRVLTEMELLEYNSLADIEREEYLIKKWTVKEAIFKSEECEVFEPSKIDVSCYKTATYFLKLGDLDYVCSLATEMPANIRIFSDIKF